MMAGKKLPDHLCSAFLWTLAAGELDELLGLAGKSEELAKYARDSEANARSNDVDDVTGEDIESLAVWLSELDEAQLKGLTARAQAWCSTTTTPAR